MSNVSAVEGHSLDVVDLGEELRAFDRLPTEVRQALRNSCVKWNAAQLLDQLSAGRMTRSELVRELEYRDRKLQERVLL